MDPSEKLKQQREGWRAVIDAGLYSGKVTSCINCENFDKKGEICILAGSKPPARVIMFGCPAWLFDIPF